MTISELDATFDARHELDPARAHARESLVWVLPLPDEGLGAFAYTWVDAHGQAGAAGVAFGPRLQSPVFELVDDIDTPGAMGFEDWDVGPLRLRHGTAHERADVAYHGEGLSLELAFEALHRPYAYSSHPEAFPSFFADERLEQGGRAKGTLRVGGEEIAFDAYCHRDHSWGARDWGSVSHYKWLNFLGADASVHVMDLQSFGRSAVRGYVHRDGETAQIVAARFDYALDADLVHRRLAAELDDDAGRTTAVALDGAAADLAYPINPRLTLVDVVGAATVDGAPGVVYAEMAWPPEYLDHGRAAGS